MLMNIMWLLSEGLHRYHTTEDTSTENDGIKFEYSANHRTDHLSSKRAHRTIIIKTNITQSKFSEVHQISV